MAGSLSIPDDYVELLDSLKQRVRSAQVRAASSVNRELVLLYWQIGCDILERQRKAGWGAKVIDRLSADLRTEFPEVKGFSARNLKYMRAFAEAWPDEQIVQQAVAQIPWGHNVRILDRIQRPEERRWYVEQTLFHGWSRDVLLHQIDTDLYARQGKAVTNFQSTLPSPQSDLAQEMIKDPYTFDFLSIAKDAREADLHLALLLHIREFLLELGVGFAYVGSNVPLRVGSDDFYLDLLFYHLRLRCFVVIDLKMGRFQPEYAGKMSFYLTTVDEHLRHPDDQPSIGIILCREKNRLVVEYTLRDMNKPIGVPEYTFSESLPKELAASMPSVEEIEAGLDHALEDHADSDLPE